MRVSALLLLPKAECDSVLLPRALVGGLAPRRVRPGPGRRPGSMSMAIDTKGVCRARDPLPGRHQVDRGQLLEIAPGVVYLGPPAQTPAPLSSYQVS